MAAAAARLKRLVSKKKRRFNEGGFDLDLTYINRNLIAMGFPAERLEGIYRNRMEDIVRFFDSKHPNHYKVYNLCSERWYEPTKFHDSSAYYPFDDHNPPPFEMIEPFCEDVHKHLTGNKDNVAVVHCKAGKGRTGVMICCYMLHSGQFDESWRALQYYGEARTKNAKGVTIPSQRRYVLYYDYFLKHKLMYVPETLVLTGFVLNTVPNFSRGCSPFFVVSEMFGMSHLSPNYEFIPVEKESVELRLPIPIPVSGDVKVEFFHQINRIRKEKMFHFWFNTFFVSFGNLDGRVGATESHCSGIMRRCDSVILTLNKDDIEKANKDNRHFTKQFQVKVLLSKIGVSEEYCVAREQETFDGMENEDDTFDYSDTEDEDEDEWSEFLIYAGLVDCLTDQMSL
ncbi:phosphatidylinositol 3,4,5-trisphosphate 3-phosphatase and dual-specificity protein phosphatase PTEN-like isoform X2 [Corticium candelabrum]|uniref:phosphatidylinositol 3,4,5-trisphosphate 3-phosphatase and dual-specificity protein phosphatase PTEN-like isoform X2 n=1 Tax=Corticium candelabrum TaxID=121492 RepID=UPI002E25EC82|nr:phosphatidylinositol 3,4,5-trisphosphate 3-phosphatase and dual-specificity protein phosphatase PTEN-like isoform X2 [Corticium candelabrum]